VKRALVTGASSGIGRVFAELLARDGYDLCVVARRRDRLHDLSSRLQKAYGVAVEVLVADLADTESLAMVETRVREDSSLYMLVNNAGFGNIGAFHDLNLEMENEEIHLNVRALVRLTHAAIPGMVARHGGAIINVSSIVAFLPVPFLATYAATKAYVNSFSEAIHEELKGTGVTVQALCPGRTHTEFHERAGISMTHHPSKGMEPEPVVEASLRALQRGSAICIPGLWNRFIVGILSLLPRSVVRKGALPRMRKLKADLLTP